MSLVLQHCSLLRDPHLRVIVVPDDASINQTGVGREAPARNVVDWPATISA